MASEVDRGYSVNLVTLGEDLAWWELVVDLRENRLPDLAVVDLQKPHTIERTGLCKEMLRALGMKGVDLPRKPKDLARFTDHLDGLGRMVRLALVNFDIAITRKDYDANFYATLGGSSPSAITSSSLRNRIALRPAAAERQPTLGLDLKPSSCDDPGAARGAAVAGTSPSPDPVVAGLLYRRPRAFVRRLQLLGSLAQGRAALVLLAHALPWVVDLATAGNVLLVRFFVSPWKECEQNQKTTACIPTIGSQPDCCRARWSGSVSGSLPGSFPGSLSGSLWGSLPGSLSASLPGSLWGSLRDRFGIAGIASRDLFRDCCRARSRARSRRSLAGSLPGSLPGSLAGSLAGWLAGSLAGSRSGSLLLRAYYHLAHFWFIWPTPSGRRYLWHPFAWDDLCWIPFPGLCRLFVATMGLTLPVPKLRSSGWSRSYPSQQMKALKARAMLIAQDAGSRAGPCPYRRSCGTAARRR